MEDGIMEKVEIKIRISEEVFELLKDFCEWSGNEIDSYIEDCILYEIETDVDVVRNKTIPKANEFWKRVQLFVRS